MLVKMHNGLRILRTPTEMSLITLLQWTSHLTELHRAFFMAAYSTDQRLERVDIVTSLGLDHVQGYDYIVFSQPLTMNN